jgi:hypothetical protein
VLISALFNQPEHMPGLVFDVIICFLGRQVRTEPISSMDEINCLNPAAFISEFQRFHKRPDQV